MSYARFGDDSDVYVYADVGGYVACCGCILGDKWDFHSPAEIVSHLQEHVSVGHKVPADLLDEGLYWPDDFIARCRIHLCREQEGHDGEHTPIHPGVWRDSTQRHVQIRAEQIARGSGGA